MIWANIRRLLSIVTVVIRHGIGYSARTVFNRWPRVLSIFPTGNLNGPDRLRTILEELGGTFIKFGQMLALQPDVLPFAYCNALFDLLDRVAPFDSEQIDKVFHKELGRTPEQVFDDFSRSPIDV